MTGLRFIQSGNNHRWTDHAARRHFYGPLVPMEKPSFFARLLGRA